MSGKVEDEAGRGRVEECFEYGLTVADEIEICGEIGGVVQNATTKEGIAMISISIHVFVDVGRPLEDCFRCVRGIDVVQSSGWKK